MARLASRPTESFYVLDCNSLSGEGLWDRDLCCDVCRANGREPAVCSQRVTLKDGRSFYLCCKALEMAIREELADMPAPT